MLVIDADMVMREPFTPEVGSRGPCLLLLLLLVLLLMMMMCWLPPLLPCCCCCCVWDRTLAVAVQLLLLALQLQIVHLTSEPHHLCRAAQFPQPACLQEAGARPGRAVSAFFGYMKASGSDGWCLRCVAAVELPRQLPVQCLHGWASARQARRLPPAYTKLLHALLGVTASFEVVPPA